MDGEGQAAAQAASHPCGFTTRLVEAGYVACLSAAFMRTGMLDFTGEFCARSTGGFSDGVNANFASDVGLTSSSQVNINCSNQRIMRAAK